MSKDESTELSRRAFLATVSAAASAPLLAGVDNQGLAVSGGNPVRPTPLTTHFEGANFIDERELTEATEAVRSRNLFRFYGFTTPQKVRTFEEEFQKFVGVKYALAVTSGTAALHIALTALGVGPGDEVVLPAHTWYSCYNAIVMTGALPVFAEVDESLTMDPDDLERKMTPQTKVVMPVHIVGNLANMDRILTLARNNHVKVLEDAAQCCGGLFKGKRTGSMGDMGIYSFQINKMISSGEGGAVVTNDPLLYERAIRFHDLGSLRPLLQTVLGEKDSGAPTFAGLNYRMNEETGAIMCAQLRKIEGILTEHRRKYRYLRDKLKGLPGIRLRTSNDLEGEIGITLDVLLPSHDLRDKFINAMTAENVPMAIITATVVLPIAKYIEEKATPHPEWPSFTTPRGKAMRYGAECCPRTVDIHNRFATLSIGPKYSDADLDDIVKAVTKVHKALLT
ncbi:MAG: DegT/DnrJ/EryC1/StrS family aminotransferase [Terriglobia bacterium]